MWVQLLLSSIVGFKVVLGLPLGTTDGLVFGTDDVILDGKALGSYDGLALSIIEGSEEGTIDGNALGPDDGSVLGTKISSDIRATHISPPQLISFTLVKSTFPALPP